MPLNKNGDINQDFINTLKLQSNIDNPIISIQQAGMPVYVINPEYTKELFTATVTVTGDFLFPTQPSIFARRKFALTYLNYAYYKNAACDIATGINAIYVRDAFTQAYKIVARIPLITLTEEKQSVIINFDKPIICEAIESTGNLGYWNGAFTAGAFSRTVTIGGYFL